MAKSGKSNPATCTPEELDEIINAPSGGIQMLPSNAYDEVYPGIYIGEEYVALLRFHFKLTKFIFNQKKKKIFEN